MTTAIGHGLTGCSFIDVASISLLLPMTAEFDSSSGPAAEAHRTRLSHAEMAAAVGLSDFECARVARPCVRMSVWCKV